MELDCKSIDRASENRRREERRKRVLEGRGNIRSRRIFFGGVLRCKNTTSAK